MPAVDVTTSITIDRPCDEVARYAADPDNVPQWYVNIQTVEWQTERPLRLGSQIRFVAQFLGKRLAYTYEVVEFRASDRFVMRTSEGPFPMETTYEWKAIGDQQTEMHLRNRGRPSGFSSLLSPFMAFMIRRATTKDLQCLKRVLESEPRD